MIQDSFHFAHYKLDAYRIAHELADLVMVLCKQVPRGHHRLVSQVIRSATGTEALIAEGANRYSAKQKRQRFVEARGEAGETAAHIQRFWRLGALGAMGERSLPVVVVVVVSVWVRVDRGRERGANVFPANAANAGIHLTGACVSESMAWSWS